MKKYRVKIEKKQNNIVLDIYYREIESRNKPKIGEGQSLLIDPPIYLTIVEIEEL
jgi:hypothetical protein